jgi:ABC-type transport system substrate-binding protein
MVAHESLQTASHGRLLVRRIDGPGRRSKPKRLLSRLHGLGPMGGTDLDPILRNLGVRTIVVVMSAHGAALLRQVHGVPEHRIISNLFEGLAVNDPKDLSPQPGMARSWTVSKDGLTYTFTLRDATWTDGKKVTAQDFVYAWERVLNPKTGAKYAQQLYYLKNGEEYNKGSYWRVYNAQLRYTVDGQAVLRQVIGPDREEVALFS